MNSVRSDKLNVWSQTDDHESSATAEVNVLVTGFGVRFVKETLSRALKYVMLIDHTAFRNFRSPKSFVVHRKLITHNIARNSCTSFKNTHFRTAETSHCGV